MTSTVYYLCSTKSMAVLKKQTCYLRWSYFSSSLFPHHLPSPPSCVQNVSANPRPSAQDLAGFWDLLQLSIEDISLKFDELYHLKSNDWQPGPPAACQSPLERKVLPTPAAQCPGWGRKAAETGLSPPTTTAISPTLVSFYLPFQCPSFPCGINGGPPVQYKEARERSL